MAKHLKYNFKTFTDTLLLTHGLQGFLMLHNHWKTNYTTGRLLMDILGMKKIRNTSIENWRDIQAPFSTEEIGKG